MTFNNRTLIDRYIPDSDNEFDQDFYIKKDKSIFINLEKYGY